MEKKTPHSERMISTHSKTELRLKEERRAQIFICNVYTLLRKPYTTILKHSISKIKFMITQIYVNILILTKHSKILLFLFTPLDSFNLQQRNPFIV